MADEKSSRKNPKITLISSAKSRSQARLAEPLPEAPLPASIMVRDLDGRIYYWNASSEEKYGWSHRDAIGSVSHSLLRTVFPEPLDIINHELMYRGAWEGTLIHTRSDGSQVKVSSRWQLYRDAQGRLCTVLEVNDRFAPVDPGSAHLSPTNLEKLRRLTTFFVSRKWWWLLPCAAVLIFTTLVWLLTHRFVVTPLP